MTKTNLTKPDELMAKTNSDNPDIANLANCIEDSRQSFLDGDTGPMDPTDYNLLRGRLEASRDKLPPLYREAVFKPFVRQLNDLGASGFISILLRDPKREREAGLLLDIAHAILQNGEGYQARATDAFQELVSDLYDGFLSAEDRRGVKPPDLGVISPLVKWGRPDFGPYTWPINATSTFGVKAAIVNLPPANARLGIMAWAALGHETAGHDILNADTGLKAELIQAVRQALKQANMGHGLPEYWSSRIDETASDVLGILNMGPAAGIGLIAYFRGINAALNNTPKLRNDGPLDDSHPADILRGYLAASTVKLLDFDRASNWASTIDEETTKDVSAIRLNGNRNRLGQVIGGVSISIEEAKRSAEIVAQTLVNYKANSLEKHSLGEIQNWRNQDEAIVQQLQTAFKMAIDLPMNLTDGTFAAHAVAAAVVAALAKDGNIPLIFNRMQVILKVMHDRNPSWGPLFISHPGDIAMNRVYYPTSYSS
jgi:hypothetical protein